MKFLLVDNYDDQNKIKNLENFLLQYGYVDIINFRKINPLLLNVFHYDCVVLSGSSITPIMYDDNLFKKEIEMFKGINIPLIGICFGFELLLYAYGNKLELSKSKVYGIQSIVYKSFDGQTQNIKVWESHNWVAQSAKGFEVLATSVFGVEAVKHKSKNIYGLQFHPEHLDKNNFGYLVFNDILNDIRS